MVCVTTGSWRASSRAAAADRAAPARKRGACLAMAICHVDLAKRAPYPAAERLVDECSEETHDGKPTQ